MQAGEILLQYEAFLPLLRAQCAPLEALLSEHLRRQGIRVHGVSARVKSPDSVRRKLARPDRTYRSLWDLTDLLGLRVTTYLESTIEEVAGLVENHFRVDFGHVNDRLRFQDFRHFGYRSLHYVCRLDPPTELPEAFRYEIQIRTILQHAWAEIEHDLGYKASDSTPESIRRRFSRIAGLLEIADEEFVSIRRDLAAYEASLAGTPKAFALDRLSLKALTQSPAVEALDRRIGECLGTPVGETPFDPEYLLKMLRLAGFRTTEDVQGALAAQSARVVGLIPPYFAFARPRWGLKVEAIPRGYGLFFLSHSVILQSPILDGNKSAKLAQFYRELDYPHDERAAFDVAEGLIRAFRDAGCLA